MPRLVGTMHHPRWLVWAQISFCERLALILTFSPWEKEQPAEALGNMFERPAPTAAGLSKKRPTFLPLPRRMCLARGAHAPSRASVGASPTETAVRKPRKRSSAAGARKVCSARAPNTTREGACAPQNALNRYEAENSGRDARAPRRTKAARLYLWPRKSYLGTSSKSQGLLFCRWKML